MKLQRILAGDVWGAFLNGLGYLFQMLLRPRSVPVRVVHRRKQRASEKLSRSLIGLHDTLRLFGLPPRDIGFHQRLGTAIGGRNLYLDLPASCGYLNGAEMGFGIEPPIEECALYESVANSVGDASGVGVVSLLVQGACHLHGKRVRDSAALHQRAQPLICLSLLYERESQLLAKPRAYPVRRFGCTRLLRYLAQTLDIAPRTVQLG